MTRRRVLWLGAAGLAALLVPTCVEFAPRLVWNATPSAPIGFYTIEPGAPPELGDLVAVTPPPAIERFIVERGYLGPDMPILKRVVALPGQSVCRIDALVTVDGRPLGAARARDGRGRPLPDWQGCRVLQAGEIFLMNPLAVDSLDGRYFGPLPASAVRGRARALLTDPDGDGRFHWRADDRELARFFSKGDSR